MNKEMNEINSKPNFNISKDYFERNFDRIKTTMQEYVDGTGDSCGDDSEECEEAKNTQVKVLSGNLNELSAYLSQAYYAVGGDVKKYYNGDKILLELFADLDYGKELASNIMKDDKEKIKTMVDTITER